jgi:hypothetical protein
MRFTLPFAALSLALLLAACQAGADGSRGPVTRGPGTDAAIPGAEADAVMAFSHMCATLDRAEVVRNAGRFSFVPVRSEAIPDDLRESLARVDGTLFMRPGGPPAMLIWSEPSSCELWVGDVDLDALDREFAAFLGSFERVAAVARFGVTRLTPEELARAPSGEGMRVRQGAMIHPSRLVPGANRVMVLRIAEAPFRMRALMVHRHASPPSAQPAATRRGEVKDPVR